MILKKCIDFDRDIMKEHEIKREDLVNGVKCTNCDMLGMQRTPRNWVCPKCEHKDRHAHHLAIKEYLLLYQWITNQECKNFLQVNSRYMVNKALKNINLTYEPANKRWIKISRNNVPSAHATTPNRKLKHAPTTLRRQTQN